MKAEVRRWVNRLFEAYESGERSRLDALLGDGVIVRDISGTEHRGRDAALAAIVGLLDAPARTAFTTHSVIGDDACVLVTGRRRVAEPRGHSDRPAAWVMRFADDGRLLESTAFASRDAAERMFGVLC